MLQALQKLLATIYDVPLAHDVAEYLLTERSRLPPELQEDETDEQVLVDVRLAVDPGEDAPPVDVPAGDSWSLLSAGALLTPVAPREPGALAPCVGEMLPAPGAELRCTLAFAAGDGSKTLAYRRGDEQRQWALDA